jgi:hypothetical protein
LIDVEIDRYDWSAFACGCGKTAAHLADDLKLLAEARSREGARALRIDDHALIQSFPQEPAVPVAAVLLAALSGDLALGARAVCLDLLLRLVDTDDEDSAETCQQIARQGLWGLYRDLWFGASRDIVGYAYEILQVIETDEDRLRACRNSGQLNLPDDLFG